ncbi:hypothetical protein G1C97_1072 [Bifidobacterium sp. DSM 109959]|uniref:Uncharacterized protein n=1 Tax=Bifidobacterium olomucense TaxID=2675324 RepID=A0A7Y0EXA7_9BIFI|nr:hypothetical protein [Bifidobacterium sp. DSM 109959]
MITASESNALTDALPVALFLILFGLIILIESTRKH